MLLLLLLSLLTVNPFFTFLAVLFPFVAAKLLWKKNEPPVLFLGLLFQWLQVVIKVFYADIFELDFRQVTDYPKHIHEAFLLSLGALFVEALGIHLLIKRFAFPGVAGLQQKGLQLNLARVTLFYVVFAVLSPIVLRNTPGGLAQFVYKIIDFKWAVFFVFYSLTFLYRKRVIYFYLIISVEIILGFTGYFSGFKDFFLFVAICYLTLRQRLTVSQYVILGTGAILLFNIMVLWQTVKNDYRTYLSGGVRAQIVTVTKTQALNVLYFKVSTLTVDDYRQGMRQLVDRISYIGFFSATQSYVPAQLPYERGRLWKDALIKIVTPRILFPNKQIIDDSEKTRKYTGLNFAGASEGTSISLGYVTESYVDFGPVLMFVPLFLFGMAIGWLYKYIITGTYSQILGYACVIPLFFQIYTFELALDKAVGALFAYFIVYLLVRRLGIPLFHNYISRKKSSKSEHSSHHSLV